MRRFFLGFLLVALIVAGGVSYLASSSPDGLDATTLSGCTLDDAGEPVGGECVAQNAGEHRLADGPFADYSVGGAEGTVGIAGVLGVLVTLVVAGGLFRAIRQRPGSPGAVTGTGGRAGPPTAGDPGTGRSPSRAPEDR